MLKRSALVVLLLMVALLAVPTFAAPVPSKTAANQSLATRDADLALVRDVAANEQVAKVLAARGFTQEQVQPIQLLIKPYKPNAVLAVPARDLTPGLYVFSGADLVASGGLYFWFGSAAEAEARRAEVEG